MRKRYELYIKKDRERKYTCPKKVCHMLTKHVTKKRKRRKDAYPKKVCLMPPRNDKKKERREKNIAHTKNITGEREII